VSYFATGPCCLCGDVFSFNPELVPSIPVDEDGRITPEGVKRPICAECVGLINGLRTEFAQPLIRVAPGAYGVAEGFPP
jgi:hypothetical protein